MSISVELFVSFTSFSINFGMFKQTDKTATGVTYMATRRDVDMVWFIFLKLKKINTFVPNNNGVQQRKQDLKQSPPQSGSIGGHAKNTFFWKYTDSQKHESTLLHTYVLNEFLTADHSCTTKHFWKNSYWSWLLIFLLFFWHLLR